MADEEYNPYSDDAEEPARIDRDAEKKLELLKSVEKSDLHWVLSDVRGRRFLARILSDRGLADEDYVPGSFDQTAYQLGQRSVARELFDEIRNVDLELYFKMVRESEKFKVKTRRKKNGSKSGTA